MWAISGFHTEFSEVVRMLRYPHPVQPVSHWNKFHIETITGYHYGSAIGFNSGGISWPLNGVCIWLPLQYRPRKYTIRSTVHSRATNYVQHSTTIQFCTVWVQRRGQSRNNQRVNEQGHGQASPQGGHGPKGCIACPRHKTADRSSKNEMISELSHDCAEKLTLHLLCTSIHWRVHT